MNFDRLLVIILVVSILSCGKKHDEESGVEARMIQMQDQGADFKIPADIWSEITGIDFEEALEKNVALVFVPAKVILREKNPGVLTNPRLEITTAKGGGDIDLAKYVTGRQGTFFVQFEFEGFEHPETFQSYFVSRSKKRKLDNDIVGSGCKYYFEMNSFMLGKNKTEGLKVNTTRQRHVSVLAGHFIFSYSEGKQIFVSRVSFKDSGNSTLLCD